MSKMNGSPAPSWSLPEPVRRKIPSGCGKWELTLLCGCAAVLLLFGTLEVGFNLLGSSTRVDQSVVVRPEDVSHAAHHSTADQKPATAPGRPSTTVEKEKRKPATAPGRPSKTVEKDKKTPGRRAEKGRPTTGDPYTLGPAITNWDEQRAEWLEKNPQKKTPKGGQPRVLLVTGSQPQPCESKMGDYLALKALKNKIDYCQRHDIGIFYNMALVDKVMAGFWAKLPLLRKIMLGHPEVEWLWWMDSDALFTDMLFELPLENYTNYNMVLHGWDDYVYRDKRWVGLNTGSFLLRNNQWSLDLLDIWAPMGPEGTIRIQAGKVLTAYLAERPPFEADDQSALIYLLSTREKELRPHVYLEHNYFLHGYWAMFVDKYEEMMKTNHPGLGDDRWPFVTHFVGCKPCDNLRDYEESRCVNQMERAFNFADNQILDHYGLQHDALSTSDVKRIRNDSSTPLELLGQTFWTGD